MEGESLARALLRFQSGVVAVFDALSAVRYWASEEFRVTGTQGELLIEKGLNGRLLLFNQAHPEAN